MSADKKATTPPPDPNTLLRELDTDGRMGQQVRDRFFGQSLRGGEGGTR